MNYRSAAFQPSAAQLSSFQPSAYSDGSSGGSYGGSYGGSPGSTYATEENVNLATSAIATALGIDDARARVARLESRLATLRGGGPAAVLTAVQVCGVCSVQTAIKRTEALLQEANAQARQLKMRDMLYTALTITGLLAGVALTGLLATKAWTQYQQARSTGS